MFEVAARTGARSRASPQTTTVTNHQAEGPRDFQQLFQTGAALLKGRHEGDGIVSLDAAFRGCDPATARLVDDPADGTVL
jgi:hypothetical protein